MTGRTKSRNSKSRNSKSILLKYTNLAKMLKGMSGDYGDTISDLQMAIARKRKIKLPESGQREDFEDEVNQYFAKDTGFTPNQINPLDGDCAKYVHL